MTEEFNLSDKRWKIMGKDGFHYPEEDVKEFIKRLKEDVICYNNIKEFTMEDFRKEIDKLAGLRLVGKDD